MTQAQVLPTVIAVTLCQQLAAAAIWHVKPSPTGTRSGTSWANGIDLSTILTPGAPEAAYGDEVWVQTGTYRGPFTLPDGVKLYRGFAGTETRAADNDPEANETIVTGNGASRCVVMHDASAETVLRGFHLTNGKSVFLSKTSEGLGGGALLLVDSDARIVQCRFTRNECEGGGAAFVADGSPTFINCRFSNNGGPDGALAGGAVYIKAGGAAFHNCLFANNRAWEGGAIVAAGGIVQLLNCTVTDNAAVLRGGAVHNYGGKSILANCILWQNRAERDTSDQISDRRKRITVMWSSVEGGWAGRGNIDADPRFLNIALGDYRLAVDSPCRDAGNNSFLPADSADIDRNGGTTGSIPFDLAGMARQHGPAVDMGAYEAAGGQ